MSEEKPYKDFEDWYTEVFGGHISKEQADDSLRIAYDYYVDNRRLTVDNAELNAQIDEMKKELHHRLISSSKSYGDCLDKIIGLDRLWQFGEEF